MRAWVVFLGIPIMYRDLTGRKVAVAPQIEKIFIKMTDKANFPAKGRKMRKILLLTAILSANAFAQDGIEDGTRFDYLCKGKESQAKWERHHVNLANSIVDGKIAVIDDNSIKFSQNDIQYKLDRSSGVLEESVLKSSANVVLTGPQQCKKVAPLQYDFVSNPAKQTN
jgi:hypothetical protein